MQYNISSNNNNHNNIDSSSNDNNNNNNNNNHHTTTTMTNQQQQQMNVDHDEHNQYMIEQMIQAKDLEITLLQQRVASLALQLQTSLQQQHHHQQKKRSNNQNQNQNPYHHHSNNKNNNNNTSPTSSSNNNDNNDNHNNNTTMTTTPGGNNNNNSNKDDNPPPNSDVKRRNFIAMSLDVVNVREVMTTSNGGQNGSSNGGNGSGIQNGNGGGKRTITSQKERIGRTASIATRQVLDLLSLQQQEKDLNIHTTQKDITPPVIQRVLSMFQDPTQDIEYLNSMVFAKDLLKLCRAVRHILDKNEPRVIFVQSPVYVFGDIHGNLEDLHFFSDNIWRLGMNITAGHFLFLGDYVDRGMNCLETIAYLFAMKQQLPNKVTLLRGNHETRDVNGWEEHYHEKSFIAQCRNRFGDDIGYRVWEACNTVFDRLPLAAVIDQDIFCVHGGIPRPIHSNTTRIQDILTVPKVAGINPPYEHEDELYQQVASDCIWSDPASEEQEITTVHCDTGYGESLRGGGAICFGNKAVSDFLQQHDYSYIMRAHEAHAEGVAVSKEARVFTVFSTSQDHNQGAHAMAGCILVDNDKLQVINRSPAYKNQYIHRRDSVSLDMLTDQEIQQRMKLGLIKDTPPPTFYNQNPFQQYYDAASGGEDHNNHHDGNGSDDAYTEIENWEDLQDSDNDDDDENTRRNRTNDNNNNKNDDKGTNSFMNLLLRGNSNNGNKNNGLEEDEYVFDTRRRSSVDLDSMSENFHDIMGSGESWDVASTNSAGTSSASNAIATTSTNTTITDQEQQHQQAKRRRSKRPMVAPIVEVEIGEDDDEVDTVDGDNNEDDDNMNHHKSRYTVTTTTKEETDEMKN